MTDRVHRALDGELSAAALTDEERTEMASLTRSIADAAAALRAAPAPDLADAVMRRIAEMPLPSAAAAAGPGMFARALAWLWRPRSLSLTMRPAHAFAGLAVALLGAGIALGGPDARPEIAAAPPASESPRFLVQFRIDAEDASQVALAGSFTEWEPRYTLEETSPGVWTVMVPLEPGVHDYTFIIDGSEWVVDPNAPRVDDSFGGSNSRLFLAAGDAT